MKYKNEKQLMNKLGIESWENLSREKILQFAAMMPDMDKEVMLKVIEQFPEFTKFASIVLDSLNETTKQLSESNSVDYIEGLKIIRETQFIIGKQLDKPDISSDEKKDLTDNLMKIVEIVRDMDRSNKGFLKVLSTDNLKAAAMMFLAATVFLGGKAFMNQSVDNEESMNEDS